MNETENNDGIEPPGSRAFLSSAPPSIHLFKPPRHLLLPVFTGAGFGRQELADRERIQADLGQGGFRGVAGGCGFDVLRPGLIAGHGVQ